MSTRRLTLGTWILLLAAAAPLAAQEPDPPRPVEPDAPRPVDPERPVQGPERPPTGRDASPGTGRDLQEELKQLFHRVERNLRRIDDRLADAGAGYVPLEEVGKSGLDDLLRSTGADSQQVVQDIERILKIAEEMGGQPSSSPGSPRNQDPSSQGQSPLDQPRDRGNSEREQTPTTPDSQEGAQPHPEDAQQKPERGDQKDHGPGQNKPGRPQDDEASRRPADRSKDDRTWGNLPERDPQIFRNQGGEDVPVQYRDWIESYYRRLNREGGS